MQLYTEDLFNYKRLKTREVNVGGLLIGNGNPIRVQTMTTTDTMDTKATVEQTIRCIEAGSELVRITAPSKKEAENLLNIKNELNKQGYHTPLIADIHFTPNAAEIAARLIEKVRVNPGNYVDKKKFEQIEYTDSEYQEEIDRIQQRFTPLVKICKEYGTAMRIGTNHGSLSDRIMSRYGDTPMGMVESAMEFLRIARYESYYNIILSMKASNPQVMVQAYRLLIQKMDEEFGEIYPLHLGVTEAGDGEDGRIKSAIGIGTLLEDGIGDTIRVSLTEDPELEIPVCRDIVKRYTKATDITDRPTNEKINLPYSPFVYKRRKTFAVQNIGEGKVPVVIADLSKQATISTDSLSSIGYSYSEALDKWTIGDMAADFVFVNDKSVEFNLPGTLQVITTPEIAALKNNNQFIPIFYSTEEYNNSPYKHTGLNFVFVDIDNGIDENSFNAVTNASNVVLCLSSQKTNAMQQIRKAFIYLEQNDIKNPAVIVVDSNWQTADEHLIHYGTEAGALLLDGFGDGLCIGMTKDAYNSFNNVNTGGRNYNTNKTAEQFMNNTAFGILQATRTRISKTEYISCPSCGRTLFELQETTAKIRAKTNHLKGVKIAIMGCIVNGPGEMADADFGYVGSGVGKITLYKGKEVVKKNIDSEIAVDELINLLKENDVWLEPKSIN
ncbi:(E)-4-hydroxy-3-methylbut-2-enyl-diphosphate synthase [Polluticaenibacter yanchengensis]|uniref:4-hydroxy-3-methylbut-2-en-1-yl diphosphate synthase (flavodoxin) n=1 Tax=Polluticaenibacter yanchengensis TaxID=3014562 RepID=A0ABT4UGM1_9BACT|nr:(E)-4-hydroxy-3-methylbut-2-enyl-diphosphate synthase [Chitinophagaceae bacterium LY-5]